MSNADGSGEITLPTGFFDARDPDWQALGGTTPPPDPDPDPGPDPGPDPDPTRAGSGPGPDIDAPALRLAGNEQQSSNKKIVVKVTCDEACSVKVEPKGKATIKKRGAVAAAKRSKRRS